MDKQFKSMSVIMTVMLLITTLTLVYVNNEREEAIDSYNDLYTKNLELVENLNITQNAFIECSNKNKLYSPINWNDSMTSLVEWMQE